MRWNKLVELREINRPVIMAIAGYPGMGNIGRQVISYIGDMLNAKNVAKIYSEYMMLSANVAGIIIKEDGGFELPSIEVKFAEFDSNGFFLISSPAQPVPWGQLEVSTLLMDYLISKGVEVLFVVTGFVDRDLKGSVITFGDEEWTEKFVATGSTRSETVKSIVGLAAANLTLAKISGVKYVFLSGVTEDYLPDPETAKKVLQQLDGVIGLGIDVEGMKEAVKGLGKGRTPVEGQGKPPQAAEDEERLNYLG